MAGEGALTCADIEELSGALALGAALPEEVAAVREHLAACPDTHAELRDLARTADALLTVPDEAEPPASLRERILATARAELDTERRVAMIRSASAGWPAPTAERPASLRPRAAAPRPLASQRATPAPTGPAAPVRTVRTRAWTGWLAAAAVLLVALGLGAWNRQLQHDVSDRDARLALQQQAIEGVARGGRVVALQVQPELAGARGAVLRPTDGPAVMVLEGLRRPESGKVYQLWAIRSGQPEDLGVFVPNAEGTSIVPLPASISGADVLAITIEPGRMRQPTSAPVATAPLAGLLRTVRFEV